MTTADIFHFSYAGSLIRNPEKIQSAGSLF